MIFFLCINYNFFLTTGSQPNCAHCEWNPIKNRSVLFFMLCRAVLKLYRETNIILCTQINQIRLLGFHNFREISDMISNSIRRCLLAGHTVPQKSQFFVERFIFLYLFLNHFPLLINSQKNTVIKIAVKWKIKKLCQSQWYVSIAIQKLIFGNIIEQVISCGRLRHFNFLYYYYLAGLSLCLRDRRLMKRFRRVIIILYIYHCKLASVYILFFFSMAVSDECH